MLTGHLGSKAIGLDQVGSTVTGTTATSPAAPEATATGVGGSTNEGRNASSGKRGRTWVDGEGLGGTGPGAGPTAPTVGQYRGGGSAPAKQQQQQHQQEPVDPTAATTSRTASTMGTLRTTSLVGGATPITAGAQQQAAATPDSRATTRSTMSDSSDGGGGPGGPDGVPDASDEDYVPPGSAPGAGLKRRVPGRGGRASHRVADGRDGPSGTRVIRTRRAAALQPRDDAAEIAARPGAADGEEPRGDRKGHMEDGDTTEEDEEDWDDADDGAGSGGDYDDDLSSDSGAAGGGRRVSRRTTGANATSRTGGAGDGTAVAGPANAKHLRRREQRRIYARKFRRRQTQEVRDLKASVAALTSQRNKLRLHLLERGMPLVPAPAVQPRSSEEEISTLNATLMELQEAHNNSAKLDPNAKRRIISKRARVRRRLLVNELQTTESSLRGEVQTMLLQLGRPAPAMMPVPMVPAAGASPSLAGPGSKTPSVGLGGLASPPHPTAMPPMLGARGDSSGSADAAGAAAGAAALLEASRALQEASDVPAFASPSGAQMRPMNQLGMPTFGLSPHLLQAASLAGQPPQPMFIGGPPNMYMPMMQFAGQMPMSGGPMIPPWLASQILFGQPPAFGGWPPAGMHP